MVQMYNVFTMENIHPRTQEGTQGMARGEMIKEGMIKSTPDKHLSSHQGQISLTGKQRKKIILRNQDKITYHQLIKKFNKMISRHRMVKISSLSSHLDPTANWILQNQQNIFLRIQRTSRILRNKAIQNKTIIMYKNLLKKKDQQNHPD